MFSRIGFSSIPDIFYRLDSDLLPEWFSIGAFPLSKYHKKEYASKEELDHLYPAGSWQEAFLWDKTFLSKDQFINRIQIIIQEFLLYNEVPKDVCETITRVLFPYLSTIVIVNFNAPIIAKSVIDQHFMLVPELLNILLALQISFPKRELIHIPNNIKASEELTIADFWEYNRILQIKTTYLLSQDPIIIAVITRQDLKLGKGKLAAQVAHGVISSIYQKNINTPYLSIYKSTPYPIIDLYSAPLLYQLEEMDIYAKIIRINSSFIVDAGHTQIPAGTKTVLALGPAPRFYLKTFIQFWNDIKQIT